jgi:hypothetical protein
MYPLIDQSMHYDRSLTPVALFVAGYLLLYAARHQPRTPTTAIVALAVFLCTTLVGVVSAMVDIP